MPSMRRIRYAGVVAAVIGCMSLLVLSCYPGDDLTVSESDVVITAYDNELDFSALVDYALADTVYHLVPDGGDDEISRAYDDDVLDAVRSNMNALGFNEVTDPDAADVLVAVAVSVTDYTGYYSYSPCYYYCWYYPPGWGWYYPPYMASYTYSIGTIFINMAVRVDPSSTDEKIPVAWVAALNGYSDKSSNLPRIKSGINQAFAQSKYLGAGK